MNETKSKLPAVFIVATILMILAGWAAKHWWNSHSTPEPSALKPQVENLLNTEKEQWFRIFHKEGVVNKIVVHDATEVSSTDGNHLDARFTIYWHSPFNRDGFTKVKASFDKESQRWGNVEIITTNARKAELTGDTTKGVDGGTREPGWHPLD
jgi:hypothetical protein